MRGLGPRIHDEISPSQAVLIFAVAIHHGLPVKPGNDSGEVVWPCTEGNAVQRGPDNAEFVWWLATAE